MHTLHHYIHCPFCLRVRMAFGYFQIPYKSIVLDYSEEKTPINLSGSKMLPIVTFPNGNVINESLDIIKEISEGNCLFYGVSEEGMRDVNKALDDISKYLHPLAMPAWLKTPEFNSVSRSYFLSKKEKKRGPFINLISDDERLKNELTNFLNQLWIPEKFFGDEEINILDIMLASHLYGIYCLIDFYIPKKIHDYLQRVKIATNFNYHEDYNKLFTAE